MSALAAIWHFDGRPDVPLGCERMLAALQMYGPHDVGQWSSTSVALARRLMRTLPEAGFDRQPLIGCGGRIVLVADILLAPLERWDEACLERLVGDYAFIRWDSARRQLLLARDPLGQRPLHYH